MVEGAPLLREYGSKAHRGFESLRLRHFLVCRLPLTRFTGSAFAMNCEISCDFHRDVTDLSEPVCRLPQCRSPTQTGFGTSCASHRSRLMRESAENGPIMHSGLILKWVTMALSVCVIPSGFLSHARENGSLPDRSLVTAAAQQAPDIRAQCRRPPKAVAISQRA